MRDNGLDPEATIAVLREAGASPITAIRLVAETFGVGIGEAKRMLHDSPAWADVREAQEAMWDSIADWVEAGMPDEPEDPQG